MDLSVAQKYSAQNTIIKSIAWLRVNPYSPTSFSGEETYALRDIKV